MKVSNFFKKFDEILPLSLGVSSIAWFLVWLITDHESMESFLLGLVIVLIVNVFIFLLNQIYKHCY